LKPVPRYAACVFGLVALVTWLLRHAARAAIALTGKRLAIGALGFYAIPLALNILLPAVFAGSFYLKTYKSLSDSAQKMAEIIPPEESVAIFGPEWAINFGSYHSWRPSSKVRGPVFKDRKIVQTTADLESARGYMQRWMADTSIDHIWLFDAEVLTTALGTKHARHILWSRATGQWRVIDETPEQRPPQGAAVPPQAPREAPSS
jgi:hypothetical protein